MLELFKDLFAKINKEKTLNNLNLSKNIFFLEIFDAPDFFPIYFNLNEEKNSDDWNWEFYKEVFNAINATFIKINDNESDKGFLFSELAEKIKNIGLNYEYDKNNFWLIKFINKLAKENNSILEYISLLLLIFNAKETNKNLWELNIVWEIQQYFKVYFKKERSSFDELPLKFEKILEILEKSNLEIKKEREKVATTKDFQAIKENFYKKMIQENNEKMNYIFKWMLESLTDIALPSGELQNFLGYGLKPRKYNQLPMLDRCLIIAQKFEVKRTKYY